MNCISAIPQMDKNNLIEAASAMKNCFTLVSMLEKNQPLVYVNPEFEKLTGYTRADVVGRNCRFLQGEQTFRPAVDHIHRGISERISLFQDLINYKKNGEMFWNRLILLPVLLDQEQLHFIGIQQDVSAKKKSQGRDVKPPTIQHQHTISISDRIFNQLNAIMLQKQLIDLKPDTSQDSQQNLIHIFEKLSQMVYQFDAPEGDLSTH